MSATQGQIGSTRPKWTTEFKLQLVRGKRHFAFLTGSMAGGCRVSWAEFLAKLGRNAFFTWWALGWARDGSSGAVQRTNVGIAQLAVEVVPGLELTAAQVKEGLRRLREAQLVYHTGQSWPTGERYTRHPGAHPPMRRFVWGNPKFDTAGDFALVPEATKEWMKMASTYGGKRVGTGRRKESKPLPNDTKEGLIKTPAIQSSPPPSVVSEVIKSPAYHKISKSLVIEGTLSEATPLKAYPSAAEKPAPEVENLQKPEAPAADWGMAALAEQTALAAMRVDAPKVSEASQFFVAVAGTSFVSRRGRTAAEQAALTAPRRETTNLPLRVVGLPGVSGRSAWKPFDWTTMSRLAPLPPHPAEVASGRRQRIDALVLPPAPIPDGDDEDTAVARVAWAWSAVVTYLYPAAPKFSGRQLVADVAAKKHRKMLVEALAVIRPGRVAPMDWARWRADWWRGNDSRGKKMPPPIEFVFHPGKLSDHLAWYDHAPRSAHPHAHPNEPCQRICRTWGAMKLALCQAGAIGVQAARTIRDQHFPGDAFEQQLGRAIAKAQSDQQQLNRMREEGRRWLWA